MQEKDFSKIEVKNNICINVFGYENELVFPIYVSDQKFKDSMDLLLLIDDDKISSLKLEKGIIELKNYFKQIPVPFKIYADFECNLRGVESYEGSYTKKYQDHVPCSFAYKVVCINNKFSKPILVFRGENVAYEFIKAILKEYKYCKKNTEKVFLKKFDHKWKRRTFISTKKQLSDL